MPIWHQPNQELGVELWRRAIRNSGEKKTVETDESVLKDSLGRVRAQLAMAEEGPALNLYDDTGQPRFTVGVPKTGSAFALLDANGKYRASVNTLHLSWLFRRRSDKKF